MREIKITKEQFKLIIRINNYIYKYFNITSMKMDILISYGIQLKYVGPKYSTND